MEKPNNNNYICARWRDAGTDPPPETETRYTVKHRGFLNVAYLSDVDGKWRDVDTDQLVLVDQWLDVTDVPAVPRAQVQAAVDEMHAEAARRDVRTHGYGCNDDLIYALEVLRDKCGVTPSGVDIANAPEAQCPVCGYYCLGRGGFGCIDKPSMLSGVTPSEESHD